MSEIQLHELPVSINAYELNLFIVTGITQSVLKLKGIIGDLILS